MNIPPVSTTVPNTPIGPAVQAPPPSQKDSDGDNDGSTGKVKSSNPGLGKVADHTA